MTTSIPAAQVAVDQAPMPADDGFDLDLRIVEAGPLSAALLAGTDDGCDTVRGSDC